MGELEGSVPSRATKWKKKKTILLEEHGIGGPAPETVIC